MDPRLRFNKKLQFLITGDDHDIILIGYPDWHAYVSAAGADLWIEIIPDINLCRHTLSLPGKNNQDESGFSGIPEKFFALIPDEIVKLITQFKDSHWELVKAIKHIGEDFAALINTNPCLAYLVVNMEKMNASFFVYSNIEIMQRMIRTKRKEILRLCGLPESTAMVKICSRIEAEDLDIKLLVHLRDVFNLYPDKAERIVSTLSFSKDVSKKLLKIICAVPEILQHLPDKTIFQLACDDKSADKIRLIKYIISKSRVLKQRVHEIVSLDSLEERKEKIDAALRNLKKFPPPPLPGNDIIIPVTSEDDLVSWSKRQGNCVRTYAGSVRKKNKYIYMAKYGPEEATIEILITKEGLRIGQTASKGNVRLSKELKSIVDEWFSKSKGRKKLVLKKLEIAGNS